MGERRALVIGARNDRFGFLDFVDDVAIELHKALLDGERGLAFQLCQVGWIC